MRIAVISDIHGNHIALEECLRHLETQKIDRHVFGFPQKEKSVKMINIVCNMEII